MVKSKAFKNCLALLLITLIAGLVLACVNEITKEPIEQAENNAKMQAYNVVFENAQFKEIENSDVLIDEFNSDGNTAAVNDVLEAFDDNGNSVGYVMSATASNGYGGDVKIAVGFSSQSDCITGFTVLSHSETAGLGAKCTDAEFESQFSGKKGTIQYVKGSTAVGDNEIDAISGATITTNAVTDAVNAATDFYNSIKEG